MRERRSEQQQAGRQAAEMRCKRLSAIVCLSVPSDGFDRLAK